MSRVAIGERPGGTVRLGTLWLHEEAQSIAGGGPQ